MRFHDRPVRVRMWYESCLFWFLLPWAVLLLGYCVLGFLSQVPAGR